MSTSSSSSSMSNRSPSSSIGSARRHPEHARRRDAWTSRRLGVVLVGDVADQLLDEVLEGHEPGDAAVLVDDHREVVATAPASGAAGSSAFCDSGHERADARPRAPWLIDAASGRSS